VSVQLSSVRSLCTRLYGCIVRSEAVGLHAPCVGPGGCETMPHNDFVSRPIRSIVIKKDFISVYCLAVAAAAAAAAAAVVQL